MKKTKEQKNKQKEQSRRELQFKTAINVLIIFQTNPVVARYNYKDQVKINTTFAKDTND